MLVNWLRENKVSAALFAALRIYLGYQWMTAGFHKLTGDFNAGGFLQGAVGNPVKGPDGVVYGWWVSFLESFAIPNADLFNVLIPWGELLVGLGLILGCLTTAAAFFAVVMNFSFLLSGTISHNPTDILMGVLIMIAGYNAGRYGLDRFVIPFINKRFRREVKGKEFIA